MHGLYPTIYTVGLVGRSYRDGRVLVQLVLGGDAEAGVVAAGRPGQGDCRLQLVVHLLVDGAPELSPVVAVGGGGWQTLADVKQYLPHPRRSSPLLSQDRNNALFVFGDALIQSLTPAQLQLIVPPLPMTSAILSFSFFFETFSRLSSKRKHPTPFP